MKYRKLDENGDYVFGLGDGNFYKDQPEAVAQAVLTRLRLGAGEWFLDINAVTPYNSRIIGSGTINTYDVAIQQVVLDTVGVTEIVSYSSGIDRESRIAYVDCIINTKYGQASVQTDI